MSDDYDEEITGEWLERYATYCPECEAIFFDGEDGYDCDECIECGCPDVYEVSA